MSAPSGPGDKLFAQLQRATTRAELGVGQMRRRPQILIVDRDPDLLLVLANFLADAGFDVVTTWEPLKASKCIQSQSFDVVISGNAVSSTHFRRILTQVQRKQPAAVCIALFGAEPEKPGDLYSMGIHTLISKWNLKEVVDLARVLTAAERQATAPTINGKLRNKVG